MLLNKDIKLYAPYYMREWNRGKNCFDDSLSLTLPENIINFQETSIDINKAIQFLVHHREYHRSILLKSLSYKNKIYYYYW